MADNDSKNKKVVVEEVKNIKNVDGASSKQDLGKEAVEPSKDTTPQVDKKGVKSGAMPGKAKDNYKQMAMYAVVGLLVVGAGIGSGWVLSGGNKDQGVLGTGSQVVPGGKLEADGAGLEDESTFRDSAEGNLEEGGINGEGTHHLVRPGGDSQNVYLTSTVIDLESFVGKKVEVWGETIGAREAGWLMDVGKVKVKK